jgi:ribonuclease HII
MSPIKFVVGVDEVGFGALAGSLFVAAVAFPADAQRVTALVPSGKGQKILEVTDSKKIKRLDHRELLGEAIIAASPAFAVIERTAQEIDEKLVHVALAEATTLAISRCLEKLLMANRDLSARSVIVLVDGEGQEPQVPCPVRMIAGGDATDWRIGSASVLAKTFHDVRVNVLHERYPSWGLDKSRGYATKQHKAILEEKGPVKGLHRMTYAPVRAARAEIPGLER